MANIDVSDLLSDPDFVDPLTIVHRKSSVDNFGENVLQEFSTSSIGSIQPASGRTLQRLPDALRLANVYDFYVKGTIISDGKCLYPDLIVYKGSKYAVQTIMDWSNFGEGYSIGTCVREKPAL